jgi:regulatory protein
MTSRSSASERDGLARAKALALRVLAHHARTEAQLRARLERAGHGDVAAEVLAWLRRLGYVDDAAFARGRARSLLGAGRAGPRLAERRLVVAGIPRAEARRAVAEAVTQAGDEPALCRAALARKLGAARPDDLDAKGRARAARFLLGRGFSPEVVARVLRLDE